jgi:hypothetical protein
MIIENIKPFIGEHCETTATGSLLKQIEIELSEPMLFGLGEGLGFIFWNMKTMDFPFIGGRVKTDLLTENLCRNLNLDLEIKETASISKAWDNVKSQVDNGKAVGLKLDCFHLDYFTNKFHFAGHYVAMYGYDNEFAYLVDTEQQGGMVKTTLKSLELARNEKGPMSSRNRSYTINKNGQQTELKKAIPKAIKNNATDFLNPPIKNIGYNGILKTSSEIKKWFNSTKNAKGDFQTTASLMERAGTGGSLFRNLYRDFLKESAELIGSTLLKEAYNDYSEIADQWKMVSDLFYKAGETNDVQCIYKASDLLKEIAKNEKKTMQKLENTYS